MPIPAIAMFIYTSLAYVGVTGATAWALATTSASLLVSLALSAATTAASSLLNKTKKPTAINSHGLQVNGRMPTDKKRISYGDFRSGGEWVFWKLTTGPLVAPGLNDLLHVVVDWGEGVQEIVKDYEQPFFSGSGQTGLSVSGTYVGATYNKYVVQMQSGTTFKWSDDGGGTWEATGISIIFGTWQLLNNGIYIKFAFASGYTTNDKFTFFAGDGIWVDERLIYYYQDLFNKEWIWHTFHSGTADQTVDTDLQGYAPEWINPKKYSCYSYFRLKRNFSDVAIWKRIPDFRLRRKKVDIYDPRTGLKGYSNNRALIYYDYKINKRYGEGKDPSYIDTQSVIDLANWYESEAVFHFNGVIIDPQEHGDIIDDILFSGRAFRIDSGGVEKVKIWDDDASVMTFTDFEQEIEADTSSFSISIPGILEAPHRVTASFINPAKAWAWDEQKSECADINAIAATGKVVETRLELLGCTNPYDAKRICQFHRLREFYGKTHRILCHPKCQALEQGDMITATLLLPLWSATKVRVFSHGQSQGPLVPMIIREENSAIYDQYVDVDITEGLYPSTPNKHDAPDAPVIAQAYYQGSGAYCLITDPGITGLTYSVYLGSDPVGVVWVLKSEVESLGHFILLPNQTGPWYLKATARNEAGDTSDYSAVVEIGAIGTGLDLSNILKIGVKMMPTYEIDVKNGLTRNLFTENTNFIIDSKGWSNPLAVGGNLSDYDCKAANVIHIAQDEDQSAVGGGGYREGWFLEVQDNDVVDYSAIGHKMTLGARIWVKGAVVADVRQSQYKDLTSLHLRAEGKIDWAVRNVTALLAECEQYGTANASNEVHAANPSGASSQASAVIGLQCVVRGEKADCDSSHLVIGHKVDNLAHMGTAAIQINSFPSGPYDASWKAGIDLTGGLFTSGAAIKMGLLDEQGSIIEYDSNDYSTYDKTGNVFSWVIGSATQMQMGANYISIPGADSGRAEIRATAIAGTPILYLPASGGTLARKEDTLDAFASTTSAQLASVISNETGTGLLVFATSPVLTTPNIGAATATSVNGLIITATLGTLTIPNHADAKLITSGNYSITLTATAATSVTLPTSGTLATLSNKISDLAACTSGELAGKISDETGSGALVFATSPALVTPNIGVATATKISLAATAITIGLDMSLATASAQGIKMALGAQGCIIDYGANDDLNGGNYTSYDRTNERFLFVIENAIKGYVDATGFHNGSP